MDVALDLVPKIAACSCAREVTTLCVDALRKGGWNGEQKDGDPPSWSFGFFLASKDGLWRVGSSGSAAAVVGTHGMGSGGDFAVGALAAIAESDQLGSWSERILRAVRVATARDVYSGGEVLAYRLSAVGWESLRRWGGPHHDQFSTFDSELWNVASGAEAAA